MNKEDITVPQRMKDHTEEEDSAVFLKASEVKDTKAVTEVIDQKVATEAEVTVASEAEMKVASEAEVKASEAEVMEASELKEEALEAVEVETKTNMLETEEEEVKDTMNDIDKYLCP